ncbi:MAG: alanine--tRNA ligase, partial [Nitrospiria bacterium]
MNAAEIRSQFIRYFSEHGHHEVPSSPLVPSNDPTLLFTNAGMVQFKSTFLGEERRPYARAVSSQKCIRAGGKHNDLENVGQTARHHTFFEMLGNFSFGDYFKGDAIAYAWELLTVGFKLDPSVLWVTVFQEDDEAEALWKKIVPPDRIIRLGHKDNFWQMGDVGPCGPCSEVMFDQGFPVHPDCPGIGKCDCDRYLEIWNLVFMQYSRGSDGKLVSLPKPSIDTGMGLERLSAVSQKVLSNYDTDLFRPLFHAIAKRANRPEDEIRASMPGRVIADHLRAITFLTSDGVLPSNEGRGYVLRRILRRAARFGKKLGFHDPFLFTLTGDVITTMQESYPELVQNRRRVNRIVLGEEERFIHTLNQGVQLIEELIQGLKKKGVVVLPGEELFRLYDTYGFPLDIAEEIAREAGISLDQGGFQKAMERQKERARRSWVGDSGPNNVENKSPLYRQILEESGETRFTGYDHLEEAVTLLAIFKDGERVLSAHGGETVALMFNPTPFYAESGGQVGDRGTLTSSSALVEIEQTTRPLPDLFLHHGKVIQGNISIGDQYDAIVDQDSRRKTARNHTGTHLLHAVLRTVLGDHVKQAGSLVTPDRLRFDFQHFSPLTEREVDRIEEGVNERIQEAVLVQTHLQDLKEAIATGAMA